MDADRRELQATSVLIEDGWIRRIGVEGDAFEADETIDCSRFVAIPGLINTHHHLYQTLTRGFPQSEGKTLFPWLELLYPIWAGLDEDMIHASTRAGLAELLLSGCTTAADHLYVFPSGSDHFIDVQIEAARALGMRFHPTRGSMDLSVKDGGLPPYSVVQPREVILEDSERLIQRYHDPAPGSMVRVGLAPCSPFSVTTELLMETAGLAREYGVRLHTHIAETMDEDAYSRREFGVSPIELLDRVSWAEEDVWVAHCVHPSDSDIQLLASRGVAVAHCPTSNMLLGSGLAPIRRLLDAGVTVGLGVDGSASNDANDLLREVKQSVLTARVRDGAGAMSARDALYLATAGSAACLGRDDIGVLQPGKVADIALFDADSLHLSGGQEDLVASLVLGGPTPHTVLVHGQTVVRDYDLVRADRVEIAGAQNAASARLLARYRGH
jgi:8-oxoguanine deaminase